jgi:hypothetical protein
MTIVPHSTITICSAADTMACPAITLLRTLLVFLLAVPLCLGAALATFPEASTDRLSTLIRTISPAVNSERAVATADRVYSTDRWFTFPKFEQTAVYLKQRLEQSGLHNVEISGAPADGKTQAGFWTMPLAWDAKSARLELVQPERSLLCDYKAVPASLGMWSGSTPKDGVTAELVDIKHAAWEEVKGKLVLTDKNSAGYKSKLVKFGALGAINGFSENPALADGRQWINAWGDNGWGFTKASTSLLSFSITPRQAEHLRQLMAAGKRIRVHAIVDTRYYEGRYPYITGVLPGTDSQDEVLVLGHTSEQGAQDNATGVSAMLQALSTLHQLIETGKLPRPRRSIRILLMPELYGSLSYITDHPDRMKHTVAAMAVDTPAASYDLAGTEYTFHLNPDVASSYADALILRIASAYFRNSRPWHWAPFMPGTDSYLGDPAIGVPTVWPYSGTGVTTHHNSEDKPATVDERSLRDLITIISTYLYCNANAGEEEIRWLGEIALDHASDRMATAASAGIDGQLAGNSAAGSYGLAKIAYLCTRGEESVLSTLRLIPKDSTNQAQASLDTILSELHALRDVQLSRLRSTGAQEMRRDSPPGAETIVVRRKRPGTVPLDDLPQDQWEGYPSGAWDTRVTIALYWCDGKRNLAQVIHLTEMELGPTKFDFVGYFRFLEKHGYVEFVH